MQILSGKGLTLSLIAGILLIHLIATDQSSVLWECGYSDLDTCFTFWLSCLSVLGRRGCFKLVYCWELCDLICSDRRGFVEFEDVA